MSTTTDSVKHYGPADLDWRDIGNGWSEVTIQLGPRETAPNPASTKTVLYGPGEVTYRSGPSGGVTAILGDGVSVS